MMSKKRKSKFCKCKRTIPNFKEDKIFCNKCKKEINIKIRKEWDFNPVTKIEKSKKIYNRKINKKKFNLDVKEGEGYE